MKRVLGVGTEEIRVVNFHEVGVVPRRVKAHVTPTKLTVAVTPIQLSASPPSLLFAIVHTYEIER